MNEVEQLTIVPDGTPDQARALGLHYEIVSAAQAAADTLLALGRSLKRMRDSAGYKHLGFDTFADYTETAVGIRQRQAYTYINLVERVPAQLIAENAAAGITKLALLGTLAPADQAEVAEDTDLANITVAELRQLIAERKDLGEQLSLLQAEPVEAQEVDLDAIRREAAAQARADEQAAAEEKILRVKEEAEAARVEALRLAHQTAAESTEAAVQAERNKAAQEVHRLKGILHEMKKGASAELEQKLQTARDQAAAEARLEQEKADAEQLAQARQEAEQAVKTLAEMRMQADRDSLRFSLLFDQLQEKTCSMMQLAEDMDKAGKGEQARKLRHALAGALRALADQVKV